MKKKKKITINKTKKRRKYEVEDILEFIGLINNKKIKKEGNISKKNILDNNKNKVNEKFNNMDISSEKVLDNKIIGEHEDNKLKENEYDNIQEDIKNNKLKQIADNEEESNINNNNNKNTKDINISYKNKLSIIDIINNDGTVNKYSGLCKKSYFSEKILNKIFNIKDFAAENVIGDQENYNIVTTHVYNVYKIFLPKIPHI